MVKILSISFFLCLLLWPKLTFGQQDSIKKIDSLGVQLILTPEQSLLKKLQEKSADELSHMRGRERISFWPPHYKPLKTWAIVGQIDFRHSFIGKNDVPVIINGFNLGLLYKSRHEFSLGFYWLSNSSKNSFSERLRNNVLLDISESSSQNLWYLTSAYSYYVLKSRWVNIKLPLEFGFGQSVTTTQNVSQQGPVKQITTTTIQNFFFPAQAGVYVELKVSRWFGVISSAGYRTVLFQNDAKSDFESWYYSYGAKLYLGYVYRDLKRLKDKDRRNLEKPNSDD